MQRARINMFADTDRDGKIYHIGMMKCPIDLKFTNGVAFIFYPDMEFPELHFCPIDHPDIENVFSYYQQRRPVYNRAKHNNLPIELHARFEKNHNPGEKPKKFYIGKIQFDGILNCSDGILFFAFTSDENEEELQIAMVDPAKLNQKKDN